MQIDRAGIAESSNQCQTWGGMVLFPQRTTAAPRRRPSRAERNAAAEVLLRTSSAITNRQIKHGPECPSSTHRAIAQLPAPVAGHSLVQAVIVGDRL